MSNETKAEVRGMFPNGNPNYITYPASTAVKLARYQEEFGSSLTMVLYFCIPVAEAREFLQMAEGAFNDLPNGGEWVNKARALLATLPKEETNGNEV